MACLIARVGALIATELAWRAGRVCEVCVGGFGGKPFTSLAHIWWKDCFCVGRKGMARPITTTNPIDRCACALGPRPRNPTRAPTSEHRI